MQIDLTRDQCVELEGLRSRKNAVMLAYVSLDTMRVKIFDNATVRAMVDIMEDEMRAYCNKCKKTTAQHLEDDSRLRVCDKCGRKVIVK